MNKVKALVVRVGQKPVAEERNDDLRVWQGLVGGYIQVVHLDDGVFLVCNEDGRDVCPFNRIVPGVAPKIDESGFDFVSKPSDSAAPGTWGSHRVYGDCALVRCDDSADFASLTDDDIKRWSTVLT